MNRQLRRATERQIKKLGTLDQHLDKTLRDVRAEFERNGGIRSGFNCVTDTEAFSIADTWPDYEAKGAACAALRDSFRRRGVNRYILAAECWIGGNPETGLRPTDDPDRGECIYVIAVERNGARKFALAKIARGEGKATLGPWERDIDAPQGWLFELLEDEGSYSDRPIKKELAPVSKFSPQDLDPAEAQQLRSGAAIYEQLQNLDIDTSNPMAVSMAVEGVLRDIVKESGSPRGIGSMAQLLRDNPDKFSMFATVQPPRDRQAFMESWNQNFSSCVQSLQRFVSDKREEGHELAELYTPFMNLYLFIGTQVHGALELADRIESWVPERLEKMREVGLRSSFELDEEGHIFIALSAQHYPAGIMGRINAADELFVTRAIAYGAPDFATAVEYIKQHGPDLILGSEAKELFGKMEKLGLVPPGDPLKSDEEVWQLEDWGVDEWTEQSAAEFMFAKVMNVQQCDDAKQLDGNVAGYRVRRAPDGLVLVPADSDEDIYVAVKVEAATHSGTVHGWLRGSEGKVPQYYRNGRWVIPAEAFFDMEDLPGKERLQAMPPFQEPWLAAQE